ncbi:MAG: hypothetical protein ACTSWX_12500 [Promethearchaeota archaeon]
MVTTIHVDSEIKNKLFHLKLKISEQKGRNVSYNEIISRLLENFNIENEKKTHNRLVMRKYCGSLPRDTLIKWQKEKYKDFSGY